MHNDISAELIHTLTVGNQLGEGVQWHAESKCLWWTDIQSACIYRYEMKTQGIAKYVMPERVGCFSFIENEDRILVGFASGFAFYDLKNDEVEWLAQPELAIKGNRLNDGRTDRQGRFWAGSIVEQRQHEKQSAALYCLDSVKQCRKAIGDLEVSNGLCWSPDGLTMYHADSPRQTIYQYDFEPLSGIPNNKRVFAQTSQNSFPDGACVDKLGYLWSAQWGGAKVVRYSPQGKVVLEINIPTIQPSCVAFAGENLDLLVVTSAKQDLTAEQLSTDTQAGHVFIYQLSAISGLEECKVRLS